MKMAASGWDTVARCHDEDDCVAALRARFPKHRPQLPGTYRDIHLRHIVANRRAAYCTTALSSRLERWMHRAVAADVRGRTSGPTLEIGGGTLNHLPHEPATAPYDVVEPCDALLAGSPWRDRIRGVFTSIEDVPMANRYARIVSIATFEHVERLPELVARCAELLAEGGSLRVGIPNEGTCLWRLGTLVTGAEFRLRYGLDYGVLMRHEHVNTADEIEAVLRCLFVDVRTTVCGINRRLALYRFLACTTPRATLVRRILAAPAWSAA